MPNKQGDFVWYELMSKEPAKAQDFYKQVAGLEIGDKSDMPGDLDYRMVSGTDGFMGGMMVLTQEMSDSGAKPGWLGYIGVEDVDATVAAITEKDGTVHMPPRDMEGVGRMAMVGDPQGAVVYVMRGFSDDESTAYRQMEPGYVAWNELVAKDQASAFEFYSNIIGWSAGQSMDMGENGIYQMFDQDGKSIGAVMDRGNENEPPYWRFYIAVSDIDDAVKAVSAAGGSVIQGPHEIPGGDYIIVGNDAEGAVFALVGPRKS